MAQFHFPDNEQTIVRQNRFCGDSNELILANVDTVVKRMGSVIKSHLKTGGKFEAELANPALIYHARNHYQKMEQKILAVPQHFESLAGKQRKDVDLALICYTMEGGYVDQNEATRRILTGKQKQFKYPTYLSNLWVGATYMVGESDGVSTLYRGVNGFANLKPGDVFAFPGMTSTSEEFHAALKFTKPGGMMFVLHPDWHACEGIHGIAMKNHSLYPAEAEFLLSPLHSFKVVSVTKNKYKQNSVSEVVCSFRTAVNVPV